MSAHPENKSILKMFYDRKLKSTSMEKERGLLISIIFSANEIIGSTLSVLKKLIKTQQQSGKKYTSSWKMKEKWQNSEILIIENDVFGPCKRKFIHRIYRGRRR